MSFQTWRTLLNLRIWRRCIYRGHCRLQHPWKRTWWNVSVRRSRSWECPMLWKRLDSGRTTSRARRILVDRCVVPNLPVQPNSPNILKVNFVPTSFTRGKKRQVMASLQSLVNQNSETYWFFNVSVCVSVMLSNLWKTIEGAVGTTFTSAWNLWENIHPRSSVANQPFWVKSLIWVERKNKSHNWTSRNNMKWPVSLSITLQMFA